ncbi:MULTISPECIES: hypothetical protein [unclassified Empedobacter]|uniref:hypothetical protein n=1 Tax=unclassified Empedobacter TaxID=2643773 RepID=UPI0025C3DF93|nr:MULTISPECIES: hypothetical protein [unclassified Empedobacter]
MKCRSKSKQKLFVFEENRSKLTLENKNLVDSETVKVDGCEIDDESIRCDFLHIANEIEFFIELKGQDIEHALNQIKATIKKLSKNIKNSQKKSYVICTRSPLTTSEIQNHKYYFRKNYNSELIVKSSPFKDSY